jgi:hypothetical protein
VAGSVENCTWSSDVVPTTVDAVVDVPGCVVLDDEPPSSLQAARRLPPATSGTRARAARRRRRWRAGRDDRGEVTR